MKKTVTFTVCARPFYLEPVLASWAKVRGKEGWRWQFGIEPTTQTDAQLRLIGEFAVATGLEIDVWVNPTRLGVLVNPWACLDKSFATGAEFTVLAEEDLTVATDVLEYFEWAAEEFLTEPDVGIVNARGFGEDPLGDTGLVRHGYTFPYLLWGTWADRWTGYMRDTWDKDYSSGGAHNSGWDWNLTQRVLPANAAHILTPLVSRSDHIGEHAGAHMLPQNFAASQVRSFRPDIEPTSYHF